MTSSFSKWKKFISIPGGIGTSPDPIPPLALPPGIVDPKMDLCPFFSMIIF